MTDAIDKATVEKDFKQLSRGASLDMSSATIMRRLEIVDEMRELAIALAQAKNLCNHATTLNCRNRSNKRGVEWGHTTFATRQFFNRLTIAP